MIHTESDTHTLTLTHRSVTHLVFMNEKELHL
jgi:hypothetical protein